jgi:hypothetical protein
MAPNLRLGQCTARRKVRLSVDEAGSSKVCNWPRLCGIERVTVI